MAKSGNGFLKAMRSEFKVRKIICVALLLFCMLFIIYQKDSLEYGVSYVNNQRVSKMASAEKKAFKEKKVVFKHKWPFAYSLQQRRVML